MWQGAALEVVHCRSMLSFGGVRFFATPKRFLQRTIGLSFPFVKCEQSQARSNLLARNIDCRQQGGLAQTPTLNPPIGGAALHYAGVVESGLDKVQKRLPPVSKTVLKCSPRRPSILADPQLNFEHDSILLRGAFPSTARWISSTGNAEPEESSSSPSSQDPPPVEVLPSDPIAVIEVNQSSEKVNQSSDEVNQISEATGDASLSSEPPSVYATGGDRQSQTRGALQPKQRQKERKQQNASKRRGPDYNNISAQTFHECEPEVIRAIKEADFIGFDLEYTGVVSAPWRQANELDTKDTIYANRKHGAKNFMVLQVGLCPFRWNPALGHFKVSPFKFLIFPRITSVPPFLCQPMSMKFLSLNKIDISESIDKGIPYLSEAGERARRKDMLSKRLPEPIPYKPYDYEQLSAEDTSRIEAHVQRVMGWHESIQGPAKEGKEPLQLPRMSLLQRRVLAEAVQRLHPMLVPVTSNHVEGTWELGPGTETKFPCSLAFFFAESVEAKAGVVARIRGEIMKHAEARLRKEMGFKILIDELAKAPGFLVGHNCMLDLMHLQEKFGSGLPPDLAAFCVDLHSKFPVIFDTKHILYSNAATKAWGDFTSLQQAFMRTEKHDIAVVKAEGFDRNSEYPPTALRKGNAHHDGALDAFTAGLLFARLAKARGIEPGELRSLPGVVDGAKNAERLSPMYEELNVLRAVLKRPGQPDVEENRDRGEGQQERGPLQTLADNANRLYAGTIRQSRVSLEVSRQGNLRACRLEDDPRARPRLNPRRSDVLLLWDFPERLTDVQLRNALHQSLGKDLQPSLRACVVKRLDAQSALVLFPSIALTKTFWESALSQAGEEGGGGGELALEVDQVGQVITRVETWGTYVALCESGVTATSLAQAATWVGLDNRGSLRSEYVDPKGILWAEKGATAQTDSQDQGSSRAAVDETADSRTQISRTAS